MDSRLLIEELIARGVVSSEDVKRTVSKSTHRDKPVERALVDSGFVDETTMLGLMSEVYGLPLVQLTPEVVDTELGEEIPRSMLENYVIYPLRREPGSEVLPLATNDPFDVLAEDAIRLLTGREVRFVLAPRAQILSAIKGTLLGSEGFRLLVEQVPELDDWEGLGSILEAEELNENAGPIIRLVNSILLDAVSKKASDIHVEPREHSFRVRYRVDGVMRTIAELPKRAEKTCISRIKIIAGVDITESRKAQDGRLSLQSPTGKVNMRVSTVPSQFGEKVVMRILDQSAAGMGLDQIGLSPENLSELRSHISASNGMILITGPTGSGKSTTLYAVLRLLNKPTVNIVTVEDPVEFQVDGITQVQVNPRAGLTFASTLRSFLRQDPDIIMVGEIRDLETAETAVQAAQTGHLVLSTLHTNDAPGTLSRMVMMGVEPHLLADCLLCVVAQRLVRRLCPECMAPTQLRPEQDALLKLAEEQVFPTRQFRPRGCAHCNDTGYKGRLGLYEVLTVTSSLRRQMLLDTSETALWRVARAEGMVTLLQDGVRKVQAGLTSIDEVLRTVTIRRIPGGQSKLWSEGVLASPPESSALQSRTVRDVMLGPVTTVSADLSLRDTTQLFLHRGLYGAPVVDGDNRPVGWVSFRDLAVGCLLHQHAPESPVRQAMSSRLVTVGPDESAEVARQLLRRHGVHRILVMEEDRLVGLVGPGELSEASTPPSATASEETPGPGG